MRGSIYIDSIYFVLSSNVITSDHNLSQVINYKYFNLLTQRVIIRALLNMWKKNLWNRHELITSIRNTPSQRNFVILTYGSNKLFIFECLNRTLVHIPFCIRLLILTVLKSCQNYVCTSLESWCAYYTNSDLQSWLWRTKTEYWDTRKGNKKHAIVIRTSIE